MHVESRLSKLLIFLLHKYDRVRIGDLGVFHLEKRPPHLDEVLQILHPPDKKLMISPLSDAGSYFLDLIEAEELCNHQELEELSAYLTQKSTDLFNTGSVSLGSLGLISSEGTDRALRNTDIDAYLPHNYLPPIAVREVPAPSTASSSEGAVRGGYSDEPIISPSPATDIRVPQIEEFEAAPPSMVGTQINTGSNVGVWANYMLPLILLIAGVASMILVFKYCAFEDTLKVEETVAPVTQARAPDDIDPLDAKTSSDIFHNPILNKYKEVLTQEVIDSGCKITVGSFRDVENADTQLQIVTAKGYDASLLDFDSGTRVIITFDCAQHDLIEYLQMIRKDVSPKAWYYQPTFEPDLD